MTKRVLITGIDGFTGRYLASALEMAGHEVHGLVHRMPAGASPGAATLHQADLADAQRLAQIVGEVRPHWVAHLAAIAFVAHGDVDAMYRVNLLGTRNLLEAMSQAPVSNIESVLIASSANVYGNSTEGMLDENTAPAPANDYAVSKLAMEYLARLYAGRLPIVVTRPFNYTGVGQAESFLIPKIVAHVRQGAAVIELGNLDVARDFSDVRMVVQAYARLLETPAAIGQTLNVCAGRAYTLNEVLQMVKGLSHRDMKVRVNPAFVRKNDVKVLLGNRAKLEACIGALETIDLTETLKWMIETD
jgi:nucleoside-diphosphate-sugar epimerase